MTVSMGRLPTGSVTDDLQSVAWGYLELRRALVGARRFLCGPDPRGLLIALAGVVAQFLEFFSKHVSDVVRVAFADAQAWTEGILVTPECNPEIAVAYHRVVVVNDRPGAGQQDAASDLDNYIVAVVDDGTIRCHIAAIVRGEGRDGGNDASQVLKLSVDPQRPCEVPILIKPAVVSIFTGELGAFGQVFGVFDQLSDDLFRAALSGVVDQDRVRGLITAAASGERHGRDDDHRTNGDTAREFLRCCSLSNIVRTFGRLMSVYQSGLRARHSSSRARCSLARAARSWNLMAARDRTLAPDDRPELSETSQRVAIALRSGRFAGFQSREAYPPRDTRQVQPEVVLVAPLRWRLRSGRARPQDSETRPSTGRIDFVRSGPNAHAAADEARTEVCGHGGGKGVLRAGVVGFSGGCTREYNPQRESDESMRLCRCVASVRDASNVSTILLNVHRGTEAVAHRRTCVGIHPGARVGFYPRPSSSMYC